jgi:hypothetical protein
MTARISDIEHMESGYGFTLEDSEEVPAVSFVYPDEKLARAAAKLVQAALASAMVMPPGGF